MTRGRFGEAEIIGILREHRARAPAPAERHARGGPDKSEPGSPRIMEVRRRGHGRFGTGVGVLRPQQRDDRSEAEAAQ